tara:strand:+ start:499 stop:660 length:162 start_codon:yes stop_codon:yes gene_type:complete
MALIYPRDIVKKVCEDRGIDLRQMFAALGDHKLYYHDDVQNFINDWCEEHDIF